MFSKERVNFEEPLTLREIELLERDPYLQVLQTYSPVESKTWQLLNENLFARRHDVELRVYGVYSSICDLSFLKQLVNVRHFTADCLMKAVGIEYLAELVNLESLGVGIYDLNDFNFLANLPKDKIRKISLGATKSKQPRLDLLERFQNLNVLYIEGQQKDIEVISSLTRLEDLTLRSISPAGLSFVQNLQNLWSLDIKLGGIRDISALEGLNQIKYLELWQVKGLSDINVISTMLGLQYLFLQSLRNVYSIPDLSKLTALRRIYLENMKGLKDISLLSSAPSLQEFIHVSATGMEPEDYEGLLKLSSLKKVSVGFGSTKKNCTFRALAARYGISEYEHNTFIFARSNN